MSPFVERLMQFLAASCPYDTHYIQTQLNPVAADEDAVDAGWDDPPPLRRDGPLVG